MNTPGRLTDANFRSKNVVNHWPWQAMNGSDIFGERAGMS
jgi:hypothetical protein